MSSETPHIHMDGCGDNAAAYVLGALTEEEHGAFLAHLESCSACREEVSSLQLVASALAAAVPQLSAPGDVRERVMATVNKDASLHERAAAGASRAARPNRPPRRLAPAWLAWRPPLAGAFVAIIVVGVLAVVFSSGSTTSSTRLIHAEVTVPRASVTVRLNDGHAELDVAGMPQPTPGRVYEVWLVRSGAPQPTDALFTVSRTGGYATVAVPGSTSGVKEILVSSEPLGGSLAPTRTPVIVAHVS
jgi:anti-sigma-K factor RskA